MPDERTAILETIHGSRLYGLSHVGSDEDLFRVVRYRRKPLVSVRTRDDGSVLDYVEFGLDDFVKNVYNGSHQSCEALWSPYATIHPDYVEYLNNLRVTGADVFARYRRTIKAFSYGDLKKRRHAVRLGFNLSDLRKDGRFNPVLTEDQKYKTILLSQLYSGQSLYDIAINL